MGSANTWILRLLMAGSMLLLVQVVHHFHGTLSARHLSRQTRDAEMYIMNRAVVNVFTSDQMTEQNTDINSKLEDNEKEDKKKKILVLPIGRIEVSTDTTQQRLPISSNNTSTNLENKDQIMGSQTSTGAKSAYASSYLSGPDGSSSDSIDQSKDEEEEEKEEKPLPLQIPIPDEEKYIPDSRTELGPNLRYMLNVMYNNAGFQAPPSQIPIGIWNTTSPRNDITEHTAWEVLGRREVPGVNCPALMRDEEDVINHKERSRMQLLLPTDEGYETLTNDCPNFIKSRGYVMTDNPEAEEFPIAYSLLTFADLSQTERLLRAIYRPQNFYCIHLERYSPESMNRALHGIANCLPNVFVLPVRYHVTRFLMSVLQPELACMEALYRYSAAWKYFINLTGQEFPLVTNLELVQTLKKQNGKNIIGGMPIARTRSVTRIYNQYNGFLKTDAPLGPAPHTITIYKGPVHIAVTRGFVDQLLHDRKVDDLLEWLRKMRTPDESLFATLHFNPSLNMPGSPKARPHAYLPLSKLLRNDVNFSNRNEPSIIRFKRFVNHKCCPGSKVTHEVCIVGTKLLPVATHSGGLFANKFHTSYQPVAYDCLENWHFNKTLSQISQPQLSSLR